MYLGSLVDPKISSINLPLPIVGATSICNFLQTSLNAASSIPVISIPVFS